MDSVEKCYIMSTGAEVRLGQEQGWGKSRDKDRVSAGTRLEQGIGQVLH